MRHDLIDEAMTAYLDKRYDDYGAIIGQMDGDELLALASVMRERANHHRREAIRYQNAALLMFTVSIGFIILAMVLPLLFG